MATLAIENEEIPTMDTRGDGYALVFDAVDETLLEVDACAGSLSPFGGASGVGLNCGIAFGPGGDLYGLDNSSDQLIRFDLTTGEGTPVGSLGFDLGACGLTYDCSTDTLIGANATTGEIFKVDVSSGAAMDFVETDVPFHSVGLEFEASTGLILASTNDAFFEVDPATGASSRIGEFPTGTHMNDLAFHPPCP